MAEGIFRDLAKKQNLVLEFDSCGTGGWHKGEAPDQRAQQCLEKHGISISDLRACQFQHADFDAFDVIFTMDETNHRDILNLAKTDAHRAKVKMVLNETAPKTNASVPDPYFGEKDGFEHVFNLLTEAAKSFYKSENHE
jgi:protein-tyrosine phosphatase